MAELAKEIRASPSTPSRVESRIGSLEFTDVCDGQVPSWHAHGSNIEHTEPDRVAPDWRLASLR